MKATFEKIAIFAISIMLFSVLLTSCAPAEQGTVWHYGEDEPSEAIAAAVGDFYMKTDSHDVYVLEENGWKNLANLGGEDGKDGANGKDGTNGKDGATWLHGAKAPTASDGVDGDLWLDTEALKVYAKASGAWTEIADLNK